MIDPDSVDMSSPNNEIQYDNTYVLLFYRQQYLACSVLGDAVSISLLMINKTLINKKKKNIMLLSAM